ncbi:MAG TPA: PAAR domain-containing protein [Bryobacteraceae bacterium]|nr:PAAR domain-containing protein [Bryobacteraceae bacterium]
MPPAARVTDMHTCPQVTVLVPHVGGPILPPGCPTVLIGFLPAARVGDMATCVGPPDTILMGSPTVIIGNMMAARLGDPTVHGGVIVLGCPTVIIGDVGAGSTVSPDSGMGRVSSAMAQAAGTPDPPTNVAEAGPAATGATSVVTPQEKALLAAADDGTPLVKKCPYANH